MQQKITFKRITNPKGKDFQMLWKIYLKCFPIKDERETKSHILGVSDKHKDEGRYVESFLLSANINGKPVGGAVFDYMEGRICGRKAGFGTGFYIFIDKAFRSKGLGSLVQKKHMELLKEAAIKRGASLDLILYELNDPERMVSEEVRKDKAVISPEARLRFFSNLGYRRIKGIDYIQPQLTVKSKPYEGLMLCVMPLRKGFQDKIPAEYLRQLLRLYVRAGFAGIPGSDINGRRNPDTDAAFLRMKRQLDSIGESKFLKLVSL